MEPLASYLRLAAGVLGLALSVGSLVSAHGAPGLRLHVYDGMRLASSTWAELRATAERALNDTGLTIHWRTCGDYVEVPCSPGLVASDVIVRVVETHPGMAPGHCGFALADPTGAGFVSISVGCAKRALTRLARGERAGEVPLGLGRLLGYTLAHELAHVLLPGQPHSSSGLFSGRLNRAHLAGLRERGLAFLPEDVERLRAAALNAGQSGSPVGQSGR